MPAARAAVPLSAAPFAVLYGALLFSISGLHVKHSRFFPKCQA